MRRLVGILIMVMFMCASILGILFIIPENASADVVVSGSISSDTTWNLTNSPYFVEGNVTVESGVTLTIEAGVEVKFNGSFSLIVNGTLNATGTSSLPINFTSNQSSPSKGDWLGISLKGANNTMNYCQISYGNNPLYITGSNANNSITNSKIFNNTGNGIHLNNTTNNTIFNVTVSYSDGYGFYFNSSDNNIIENSNLSYNDKDAIYLVDSDLNTFSTNSLFSNNGTGINLTSSSSSNIIKINTIMSNNKTGIHFSGSSNSNTVSRNNIINNLVDGINVTNTIGNLIHQNNFDTNGQNGYDSTSQLNSWDNDMEGNWWSDYGGSDADGDGIGDTPHNITGGGSKDFYPLWNSVNIYAPIIESTTPVNGAENVSVTPTISITFSSEMNTSSAENATSMSGGATPTNFVWSNGNKTLTFNPSITLSSETNYTVNISINAKDVQEIPMNLNYSFYFTTEDSMPPEISSTTPANGIIDVLITADIVVVFSEEMNTTSVTYTSSPDPGGWSVVWSAGNTTATYSHNDFDSETTYTFNITGAKDIAGNDLVAGAVPNPWTFTTEDVIGPEITSTTPANGTIDVLITADIVVVFTEEMNTTSVTYTSSPDPGGWSVVWSAGNTTATYSHNDFASETTYTFNITGAKDIAGNDLVAGGVPNPWTFTTEDAIAPEISSTTPANGTMDVLITADIVVVFSEEMNTTSVTYTSSPDPGGWSVVWSVGNTTATYSHNDFASETTYTFNITGAKDVAGNDLMAGAVPNPWTFTTEDVIGPEISSTTPANGTVDVLITADIVVVFSEEMNTTSVTYTCSPDPGGWSVIWSAGNTTATYSHNDFASETNYTFNITGAKDVAGNDLVAGAVPNPFTFTTIDASAPQISSTTPLNGTVDVLITADIVVVFSEEMNTTSVTYTSTPDPGGWSVVWSAGNTTATYSHNDFASETTYTFNITGAKDTAGNDLVAGAVPNPFTFTTEDVIGPEISSTTPANGTIDVLITADIVVVFNEEMNTSSVTYTSSPDPGGWSVVWSAGNTTATYSHNDFDSLTNYTFNITGAKDTAGNDLVAGAVPNPFMFTTEDVIGPEISSTTPANGTSGVLISADIVVTFNEEMNTSSVTYTSTPDPGGWSVVWSAGNTTATYSHNDFASLTTYTFNITAAKDIAGNDLVAGAVPNPWTFTTADANAPEISSTTPANGTVDVLITADIVVVFSEEMNITSITYTCTPDPGGWSVVWSGGNTTATYSHNDFASETSYTFNITGGKDTAGNDLVVGAVPNPFTFTTEDAAEPEISSTSPINGAVDVLISADIIVTFTEEMNTTTVTYTCNPDPGGWSVVWSGGNTTATYSHNDFDSETSYIFAITGAKDLAGNDLVGGSVPNPWSFTTEDVIGPEISSTSPVNGTINILISADVVVTFNEQMNTSSVTYTITPNPGGWSVVWSAGDTVATYSHNDFDSETTYTFEITGAEDDSGNALVAGSVPNPFTFTTGDVIEPVISSTSPANGTSDVLISADIMVTFSEEMNTSSVTYTCTPDPGGWSVVWSAGNTTATYSHNNFDSTTTYTFEITAAKDPAGNDLVAGSVPNPWTFTTEDVVGPEIGSTTPSNGTIDVLINADIIVTFNEEMNTSSITFTISPNPGGWSVVWSAGNTTVTYSHNDFDSETIYTFEITGAMDVAGNNLAAGSVPNPWTFTTEDVIEPEISSTTPSNGTVDVLITTDIVVIFSEDMDTSSVTFTSTPDPGGWSVVWSAANTTATYSHNDFASTTTYTFEITAAKDPAGNDLIAGSVPNPFSFTTEDVVGPQISTTTPSNGTMDVLINADIVVNFNEEMDTSSVTYTCTPDPSGWNVVWSGGNTTVTYSHNDFASTTTYTFEITGAKDMTGNDLVAGSVPNPFSFTTEDVVGPQISSTSPSDGAIDVLISVDIIVTFNEEMNTSSVTYTITPDPMGWIVIWSAANTIATYSHNDFGSEITYTFEITGAKDLAGNDLVAASVPNPWTFTTEDVVEPEINSITPVNGTIDVLIDNDIIVIFTEDMNTSSVTYLSTPDPGGWSAVWSAGNTTVTYSHNDFDSETIYTFEITGATDVAGNNLVAGAVPNPWSFTTEDAQAPTILFTSPVNGGTNIAQTDNIEVTFSEAMATSTILYASSPNPGGWFVTWSAGDTIATFSHNRFDSYVTYSFQILAGEDLTQNSLGLGAVPNPWTFTTIDSVSPQISAASPINGSVNIGLTQDVVVTFSEAMNTTSLTYSSFPDPGGWTVTWSSGDTVVTLSHNAFDDSTVYTFLIANVMDVAGNNLIAGAISNPWTFTTLDATAPEIIGSSPSDGSIDIASATDVVVTFSEEMNTAAVAFLCIPDPGGWLVSWNLQNTVATYSHNDFSELTTYTFEIVSGEDVAGNILTSGALPNPWSFTTMDLTAPEISATTPADGSVNIVLDQAAVITFTESMDNSSLTFTCTPDPGGWSVVWSGGDTVATLSHNPFSSNTAYSIQVTGAKDTLGNNFVAGSVPNPWSFTTIELIPPTITLTSPSNGTLDVNLIGNITVSFSEAMNTSLVTFTIIPDPGGWSTSWSAGDTVATFSHSKFDKSTVYTFHIISGTDLAGNNLISGGIPNPWSFTTLANTPPAILSSPILTATEDVQYNYDVEADDLDGDPLVYTLTSFPTGMTIDPATGLITWTATNNQVGANNIVVLVSDGDGGADSQSFTITVSNVNDSPTISSTPVISATEDIMYSYDVDATDVDGNMLIFSLTTFPAGMVIDNTTGMILWTPINSQVGVNNVVVMVSDQNGGTETQSFTITVENSNDVPTIITAPITMATEDELYVYDVDASDVDLGDTLTYGLSAFPTGMTMDPISGVISWTPINSQVGANLVTLYVFDENGSMDIQSFTVTVSNTNDPPNIYSTPLTTATEEIQYTYDVEAQDPDGDVLAYSLSTYPTGMIIDNISGMITWTPSNAQVGSHSVVVQVMDGNSSTDSQSYSITVQNTNDAPSIISSPIVSATEDMDYTYDVDASDIDSGDTLTYNLTTYPTGMTIDPDTGVILWTPTNSDVGGNAVTVVVSDENGSIGTQSFTVTVTNANDFPQITSVSINSATEDVQYNYDVEAQDIDVGDTLNFSLTTFPIGMSIDIATGLINWTPTNNDVGSHNVVVLVSDGNGGTDTQSFTIDVVNVNDPPTITSVPITSATDDMLYAYNVDADDVDFGDTLTFSLTMFPTGMTIDPATGLIEWTPDDSHLGNNNVNVVVTDGNTETDSQPFTIFVSNANDEPQITSTALTTAVEDSPYSYNVDAQDPDSDTMSYSLTTQPSQMTIDSATGMILWTPLNEHVGSNNVVVKVIDGKGGEDTQSFTINVANINDAPTITSSEITSATEDNQYSYDVEADDVDVGDTLTYSLTVSPSGMTIDPSTGLIIWIPRNDHVGVNNVEVLVSDGKGGDDVQSFSISVSNTNDDPTITSTPILAGVEDTVYNYNVDAEDVDIGDTLTYSLTTYPNTMVIDSVTGMITWTPTNSDVGANSVTVWVTDVNGGQAIQSFSIMVSNTNDPPTINSPPVTSAIQDSQYTYDVVATDIDSGDILTYSLTVFPVGMTINSATGEITWMPSDFQVGDNSVSLEVFDGIGEADSQSFTIIVTNINDPPTFTSQPVTEAVEETQYFYEVEAFDMDSGTLTYSLVIFPEGMVIDSVEGTITWTPTNSQVGTNPIIIKIIDGNGGEVEQSFEIIVENVNDEPTITSTPGLTAKEEVVYTYTVQADDVDSEDNLTYELAINPSGMQINSSTGIISWSPTDSQVGDNSIVVMVSDGKGGSTTQSFSVVVSNVNDAPVITSTRITDATEDEQYTYDVNAVDVDSEDTLIYNLSAAPEGMTIDSETGIITWIPNDAQVGENHVGIEVTDESGAYATQSFIITVENVNDAPEMSDVKVVPETGTNRDRYVFSLVYADRDGDAGDVKLYINGDEHSMIRVSGDTISGEVFSIEMSLGARNHTYYFEIDDDEGHIVVSEVFEISVSQAAVEPKEEELLSIPLWWVVLILIVIVLVVLGLLARTKGQLKKQKRFQQYSQQSSQRMPEKIPSQQVQTQSRPPPEKEEEEKSLLDFGK